MTEFEESGCVVCGEMVIEKEHKMHEGDLFHLSCWQDEMTARDQGALYDDQRELIMGNY